MSAFNPSHVKVGPGTLYAAPLGTSEPTSVTGAWPSAWQELGYTVGGTTFNIAPKFQAVEVEEEIWPLRQVPSSAEASMDFELAESTAQNLTFVLNNGLYTGSDLNAAATGTNSDGSIWVEPPAFGYEVRVMLGWDALPEGATEPVPGTDQYGRVIFRQCLQTGSLKRGQHKGNKIASYSVTFSAEKPVGLQPFRFIVPAYLSS